jgi:hypothetical protein
MKKCLTSLFIKEMQTKTTLRSHPTPTIKKTNNNKCWGICKEKETCPDSMKISMDAPPKTVGKTAI